MAQALLACCNACCEDRFFTPGQLAPLLLSGNAMIIVQFVVIMRIDSCLLAILELRPHYHANDFHPKCKHHSPCASNGQL